MSLLGLMLCGSIMVSSTASADHNNPDVDRRKREFLTQLADNWIRAGAPVKWQHAEWKFDEIEPNWAGALSAMRLKRSPSEIAQANAFFEAMPIDIKIDPDMRVCEALHACYLFRDDPDLKPAARKRLLEVVHIEPVPRRLNASVWDFGATEIRSRRAMRTQRRYSPPQPRCLHTDWRGEARCMGPNR